MQLIGVAFYRGQSQKAETEGAVRSADRAPDLFREICYHG
jgi:hypothetical protein